MQKNIAIENGTRIWQRIIWILAVFVLFVISPTTHASSGANGIVRVSAIQPDGKIIIGGEFSSYDGVSRNNIARLNYNGTLDTNFDSNVGTPGNVHTESVMAIAIQSDGKIIIGGGFSSYNGVARNDIARLNSDGTLDTYFNPDGVNYNYGSINSIVIQPNGKILFGGIFSQNNSGYAQGGAKRLNADGTIDDTFNPIISTNNWYWIESISIQPDGKIIIGGTFTTCNGIARKDIARLNNDGTLDAGFDSGTGGNYRISTTTIQPDGKIVIGGYFTTYNGMARSGIARLNFDGTLDTNFNPGIDASVSLYTSAIQPDGKILSGGFFDKNMMGRFNIARFNSDGTSDTSFNLGLGANNSILTIALQSNGKIIIGGYFTSYNGVSVNHIARLNSDGTLDTTFNVAQTVSDTWENVGQAGFSAGKAEYISLAFSFVNNQPYVAYRDEANSSKATVMRFDGTQWVTVGSAGFSADQADYISIAFNPATNQPYVAYMDYANSSKATVMRFDGTQWVTVGSAGFSLGQSFQLNFAFNPSTNQPYVAYTDYGNSGSITVMKFDDSQWVTVGSERFSSNSISGINFAFNPSTNQPHVAYIDSANSFKATVMKFDGSQWVTVGQAGFSSGTADSLRLAFNPIDMQPYLAYMMDYTNSYKATVMRFDGSQWVTVGSAGFSSNGVRNLNFAFNHATNQPYVIYKGLENINKVTIMKFDDSQWITVGSADYDAGSENATLVFNPINNQPYLAYKDYANSSKATVMKFSSKDVSASAVAGISIKTPPKTTYTAGQALDLSGLVVTLTNSDTSTKDVAFTDFAANSITTNKANGATLVVGDTTVTITVNGHTVSQAITVNCSIIKNFNASFTNYNFPVNENLVVITHGWNSSDTDPRMKKMRDDICNNANNDKEPTTVAIFDWKDGAATGGSTSVFSKIAADAAYNNASIAGGTLANEISELARHSNINHIHFIAHSAGSNVIQTAVDNLADYSQANNWKPFIHLTFLDAYAPNGTNERYGDLHNFTGYAEQYVDMVVSPWDFPWTNIQLLKVTNFDVTNMTNILNRTHTWPIDFYDASITDPTYHMGFSFSNESSHEVGRSNDLAGYMCAVSDPSRPYASCSNLKSEVTKYFSKDLIGAVAGTVVNATIDIDTAIINTVSESVTGTVSFLNNALHLITGSPSWAEFDVTVKKPTNMIKFDSLFPSSVAGGKFTVSVDGETVFSQDSSTVEGGQVEHRQIELPATLTDGSHAIIFRIDPLTSEHSEIYISDVRLGMSTVPDTASVYRFYNTKTGEHFFTIDSNERANINAHPEWNYNDEGIAFSVYQNQQTDTTPVYRFYNTQSGFHFFTIDPNERANVNAHPEWSYNDEGIAFHVYPSQQSDSTSVYRFYNTKTGEHFFTIDTNERANINAHPEWNYNDEGVAFYVMTK